MVIKCCLRYTISSTGKYTWLTDDVTKQTWNLILYLIIIWYYSPIITLFWLLTMKKISFQMLQDFTNTFNCASKVISYVLLSKPPQLESLMRERNSNQQIYKEWVISLGARTLFIYSSSHSGIQIHRPEISVANAWYSPQGRHIHVVIFLI